MPKSAGTGRGKYPRPPRTYPIPAELPILNDETLARLGYAATAVSPGARTVVVCRCTRCPRVFTRARRRVTADSVCASCAHATGDDVPTLDGVDAAATLETFGYLPETLPTYDLRQVIHRCAACAQPHNVRRLSVRADTRCAACRTAKRWQQSVRACDGCARSFATLRPDQTRCEDCRSPPRPKVPPPEAVCVACATPFARREPGDMCARCRRKKTWWNKRTATRWEHDAALRLLPEETRARFGYELHEVSPRSHQKVVASCARCDTPFERVRRNVLPDPVCAACSYVDRRYEEAHAKRVETLERRYGVTGLQQFPREYGGAQEGLAAFFERELGLAVVREKVLPGGQRVDVFLPDCDLGVEYCGLFWHHEDSPEPRRKWYHHDKAVRAAKAGIQLVTIFEDEWKTREAQVKAVLRARAGKCSRQLMARKCAVREIDASTAREFNAAHHLQGPPAHVWRAWGLFYGDELVGSLVLAPHHRQGHASSVVLNRLCFKADVAVTGGTTKLLAPAIAAARDAGYETLVTWSDNRWTSGNVYERAGFTLVEELPPDYSYVKTSKPRERLSKQSQKKGATGCPDGLTELEWARQRGLSRIWDCGRRRWEIRLRSE